MGYKLKIDLEKAEQLAAQGLTNEQIAAAMGIGQTTFYKRKKNIEAFDEAIENGKAKGIAYVTNKLREQIDNNNTAATIFFLKARAGWKEVQHIEQKTNLNVVNDLNELFEEKDNE